ncbi:MAG: hypothetical protein Tsb009_19990 [Planctomycetaceae bacterium]
MKVSSTNSVSENKSPTENVREGTDSTDVHHSSRSSKLTEAAVTSRTVLDFVELAPNLPYNHWPVFPHPLKHPWLATKWIARTIFSLIVLVALFSVVAAVPLLSILVLGFFLEAEGRIGRSGRWRDGFPLLPWATRIGSIALGIGLWLIPLFLLAGLAADASLIDPQGTAASTWSALKIVAAVLIAGHLCLALSRGGGFGCFFRPIKNARWLYAELKHRPRKGKFRCPDCGELVDDVALSCSLCGLTFRERRTSDDSHEIRGSYWERADRKLQHFLQGLQLKHHFLLGCRGILGALAILLVPTTLFAVAKNSEGAAVLVTLVGGLLLSIVFLYVPFLQARLASENRTGAMFEWHSIRELFVHAPIAWLLTLIVVYALALPLYLFTAVLPPHDAMWLITPVFVLSIYPAHLLAGWAYARAVRKQREGRKPSHFVFRHGCRVLMLFATVAYTFFFFFARDISRSGRLVLFEHHAFLGTSLSSLFSLLP